VLERIDVSRGSLRVGELCCREDQSLSCKTRYCGALEGVSNPIFVTMTDTDHENAPIIVDPIDYQVSLECMDSDRRRNLMALTRHSRTRGYEIEHIKKLIVISFGGQGSEVADTLFGD